MLRTSLCRISGVDGTSTPVDPPSDVALVPSLPPTPPSSLDRFAMLHSPTTIAITLAVYWPGRAHIHLSEGRLKFQMTQYLGFCVCLERTTYGSSQ